MFSAKPNQREDRFPWIPNYNKTAKGPGAKRPSYNEIRTDKDGRKYSEAGMKQYEIALSEILFEEKKVPGWVQLL
jgi:hypothetical protein